LSAPKYKIGTRIEAAGMTVIGVMDYGDTRAPQYLVDGIEGPVEERDLEKMLARKPAKKEVASGDTSGDTAPAAE
jgi:hypothetical protein